MKRTMMVGAAVAGGWLLWKALQPRFDYRGRSVLITGGSRGLGLVLARELAKRGAQVAICARDPDELNAAVRDLLDINPSAIGVVCDVTKSDQIRAYVAAARKEHGPCDVLINNAGIIGVGLIESQTLKDFDASLQTHLWAPLHMTLEVLPDMKRHGAGRIINISSIGGKISIPHLIPYSVGKFALVGLSKGLRSELARYGIVVTTVCPGLMRTGSHLQAEFKGRHEEEYRWFATGNSIPLLSINAEQAARRILDACARGDAEAVLSLSAKAAVLFDALMPETSAAILKLVNRRVLPNPGGIGSQAKKGRDSRGLTNENVTMVTDRAADDNNEHHEVPLTSQLR